MTWSKFGAEFRDECAEAGLTDCAFRTHVEALTYLYGIEANDMKVQRRLVRKWAGSDNYLTGIDELVRLGFWMADGDDWRVVHHEEVFRQSLAAQQTKRKKDKRYQAGRRAGSKLASVGSDVGSDTGSDVGATQTDRQTDRQTYSSDRAPTVGVSRPTIARDVQVSHRETPAAERIDLCTGEVLDDPWRLCLVCREPIAEELWAEGSRTHPACDLESAA